MPVQFHSFDLKKAGRLLRRMSASSKSCLLEVKIVRNSNDFSLLRSDGATDFSI